MNSVRSDRLVPQHRAIRLCKARLGLGRIHAGDLVGEHLSQAWQGIRIDMGRASHSRERISALQNAARPVRQRRSARSTGASLHRKRCEPGWISRDAGLPLTRSDSVRPGTKKIKAIDGFSRMFVKVSIFCFRDGLKSRACAHREVTKPGRSPRGDTSGVPCRSADAIVRKGERAMKAR